MTLLLVCLRATPLRGLGAVSRGACGARAAPGPRAGAAGSRLFSVTRPGDLEASAAGVVDAEGTGVREASHFLLRGVDLSGLQEGVAPFSTVLDVTLPEGRCVGVSLPGAGAVRMDLIDAARQRLEGGGEEDDLCRVLSFLDASEVQLACNLSTHERAPFIAGRTAMRQCIVASDGVPESGDIGPILKNDFGAPTMPSRLTGSISHKRPVALALCAAEQSGSGRSHVGVDVEQCRRPGSVDISRRVLTAAERGQVSLGLLGDKVPAESEVLLRFSLKESLYKAMHPFLQRYIGFGEVEVQPLGDGTTKLTMLLAEGEDGAPAAERPPLNVEAHWCTLGCSGAEDEATPAYFLTSARAWLGAGNA